MTRRVDAAFASAPMLDRARDSLADAKLLREHSSRNAAVLLDLALKQALAAISLSLGLDAPDGLPLDTLLGRVPADHPASALAGRLADPRARDPDTVDQLIDAVSSPAPSPAAAAEPPRKPAPNGAARPKPARAAASPARTTVVAGGPTAFEAAAREQAPKRSRDEPGAGGRDASSASFWRLMDRWAVSDRDALSLLGSDRTLTGKGTRPRFRLRGKEAARYATLERIGTALQVLGEGPDWLSRKRREAPFNGLTPLATLLADPDDAGPRILHVLNRAGLGAGPGKDG